MPDEPESNVVEWYVNEIERLKSALKRIQHQTSDTWAETYARNALLGEVEV